MLSYEFKAGINAYLASLGPNAPVRTLQDLIEFNERNRARELSYLRPGGFFARGEKGAADRQGLSRPHWERCRRLSRAEGIDAVMDQHQLDAIVAPAGGPAGVTDLVYGDRDVGGSSSPAAVAGYPNITVPAGDISGVAGGHFLFRSRLQRTGPAQDCVCIRAGNQTPQAAKVSAQHQFKSRMRTEHQ